MKNQYQLKSIFTNTPLTKEVYTRIWIKLISCLERNRRASFSSKP